MNTLNLDIDMINTVAKHLLEFYYYAYSKLVSYPFLYSDLVPERYACGDSKKMDGQCNCCAIRMIDLNNAISIFVGGTQQKELSEFPECKDKRIPMDDYARIAALSLDVDTMLKSPEYFSSQLYIVCVILEMQKLEGKLNGETACLKLAPYFRRYVYEIKKRQGKNIQEIATDDTDAQTYANFVQHLSVDPVAMNKDSGHETSIPLELLDEATNKFVQLHANKAGFYSTFSKIMYCIISKDEPGFDLN